MPWTDQPDYAARDPLTAGELNEIRDNFRFLHNQGADLTVVASALTPTVQFHRVTGGGTVDNITLLAAGARVTLQFLAATTLRHNAVGTGNLRLLNSSDRAYAVNEIATFISDGALWWETAPVPVFVGATVYNTAAQALGTGTVLAFDSEELDYAVPFHDTATTNSRLIVPANLGGTYRVLANLVLDNNNADAQLLLQKNGSVVVAKASFKANTFAGAFNLGWVGALAAADYLELVADRSVAVNAAGGQNGTRFSLQRVAA